MPSYNDFFAQIPIPWLTKNTNGKKFWAAWSKLLDDQANRLKEAVLASFPAFAPADAVSYLENEYGILQGKFASPPESDADFAVRLQNAFHFWPYAGTPLGLLLALYWLGYKDTVKLYQQNGRIYQLNSSSIPNDAEDYTSYLTVTEAGAVGITTESYTVTLTGTFTTGDVYLFEATPSGAELIRHEGAGTGTIAVTGTFAATHSILITITTGAAAASTHWSLDLDDNLLVPTHTGTPYSNGLALPWWAFSGLEWTNRYALRLTAMPSWWTDPNVPANSQSLPSVSEINTIFRAAKLWGPAKARCLYIEGPGDLSHFWGDGHLWGDSSTWGATGRDYVWGNPNLLSLLSRKQGLGIALASYINGSATPGGGFVSFDYNAALDHVFEIRITATGTASTCHWDLYADGNLLDSASAVDTITTAIDGLPLVVTLIDNVSLASSFVNGDRITFDSHAIR